MPRTSTPPAPYASPEFALWTPIAGLVAAAGVCLLRNPAPPPNLLSWRELFGAAVMYVLLAFVTAAIVVFTLHELLGRRHTLDIHGLAWRTALAAVWMAPVTIFFTQFSIWAVASTAVLVAGVTRLLCLQVSLSDPIDPEDAGPRPFVALLCSSAAIQAGVVAACAGYLLSATALCTLGTFVIARQSFRIADSGTLHLPSAHPASRSFTLVLSLATLFTVAGLTRYLDVQRGFGWGGAGAQKIARTARSVLRSILGEPSSHSVEAANRPGNNPPVAIGTIYPGIILWPEVKPHTTLVPPLPALLHGGLLSAGPNPLSIPFLGAYWLFKAPDVRPPQTSIQAHGSPVDHTFTSTDHAALFMEAHQNFGVRFDIACCRAIQIAISNADRYVRTVSLELILIDSRRPGSPSQSLSLGVARVESIPGWTPSISETLTFPIPPASPLRQFDEVTVRYKLDVFRADTAAKTSIDRFLLVPK